MYWNHCIVKLLYHHCQVPLIYSKMKRGWTILILNKPIQCSICAASKHPHTTPQVLWGWPLTFSCSIRGKDGRGRGKCRYPFSLPCSVRKLHGLTRNESHLWHLVPRGSIHMHLCNTTSTQTSGVWRKSKCQTHTCFLKLLEATAASCVSSVFTILATGRMSKSLIQNSTKCQRSQSGRIKIWIPGSLSGLIHSYWLQKCVHGETLHFYHSWIFQPIPETAPFKFTGLLQDETQCTYSSSVSLPLTTDFISRLWFKSRWILLTRSRSDRARRCLAGGR